MILAALLIGAAIWGLAHFWKDIIGFMQRAIEKIKVLYNTIVYGSKVFIKKMGEVYRETCKHYSKNRMGQWQETITTKEISENEVPKEIRERAYYGETEITEEIEAELTA